MRKRPILFATIGMCLVGCGNAEMKKMKPDGGTITLYNAVGDVIQSFETDGKPAMHEGGHLYCKEKETGKLVILYGTYTFVERTGQ